MADCVEEDVAALAPADTAGIGGGLPWWGWVAIALGILLAMLTGATGSWFIVRRSAAAQGWSAGVSPWAGQPPGNVPSALIAYPSG